MRVHKMVTMVALAAIAMAQNPAGLTDVAIDAPDSVIDTEKSVIDTLDSIIDTPVLVIDTPEASVSPEVIAVTPTALNIEVPVATPSASISEIPVVTPLAVTPSPFATASSSEVSVATMLPVATASASLSDVPVTVTPTASSSEVPEATPTASSSEVPEATPTASTSEVPEATPTASTSEVPEATPTASFSEVPEATPTASSSEVPELTPTASSSDVPVATMTASPSPSASESMRPVVTFTPSATATQTASSSPSASETASPSPSASETSRPVVSITPSASPSTSMKAVVTPTSTVPDSDYITCAIKNIESPLGCDELQDDESCCRYSWSCGGLHKCTSSYCCTETTPTPTPHPSPSTTPSYEPVDNYINCAVKKSEGGFKCSSSEEVDKTKECCRWSDKCADLSHCTESYCCTDSGSYPDPSPSAKPQDYTVKCQEKHGVSCSVGYELDDDKKCCEYPGACGDLKSCKSDYCCTESGSLPPVDTEGACDCDGAVLDKVCYSSIEKAITAASDGDTIFVGGDIEVDAPIQFTKSLSFSGVLCDDERAQIIATFDEVDGAIFEAVNEDEQEVNFLYLAITSKGDNSAAAFHSLGSVTDAPDQKVTMNLTNVWIHDMYSQRPGVGIFIGSTKGLTVDDNCYFYSLNMSTSEMEMYAGGAAIAVVYLPEGSEIRIAGSFKNNSAFYPDASLHSGGGAIYLDYMEGDVKFTAAFENNSANQGGAVNVQGVLGTLIVDGYYSENHAIDDGYGSRAGAFRVLEIEASGTAIFNGSFIGNTAQGRGGAIATNIHTSGGKMYLDGIFQNNVASTVGGVWSMWSNTQLEGMVQLDADSIFEGNLAAYDDSKSGIYNIAQDGDTDKLAEDEWFGRAITIN
ncbi:hypothetical protein SARC_07408 [Sphaeroforma arctica JP610]|uniref:Uncharacterized protein n=1 Tax=Sphaeroforma arctica JP610 TaxID=667725 RepID=A0A0L0FTS5_9EUKA|nr:hypothetical protein SARC_07408 [Sphaeroforma arctica JP610]KNC80230.1 hypothetical protein SARC_07408 [Sphaeroforma arctica JP610]|eukprot:XP_014154132.1 hypothetical protein SARC_07408 [Sphaeroforma arctica JP610]